MNRRPALPLLAYGLDEDVWLPLSAFRNWPVATVLSERDALAAVGAERNEHENEEA